MLEQIKSGLLLDVRTREEYDEVHADGSQLVPLDQLSQTDLEIEKDVPIFVHCKMGGRAEQAVEMLKEKGFTSVTNLGGISDMEALGLIKHCN